MHECTCAGCLQDLGPLAAAVAFTEVLKPAQTNMYKVRHLQQNNGQLPALDGTYPDMAGDWCAPSYVELCNHQLHMHRTCCTLLPSSTGRAKAFLVQGEIFMMTRQLVSCDGDLR